MGYRNYSVANSHIVDATGQGDFTTIATAMTAAVSGDTIFVRPGSYTENFTWKAGVNLTAFNCDALSESVNVTGVIIVSFAGTASVSGINFSDNGTNPLIQFPGTNATVFNMSNCRLTSGGDVVLYLENANLAVNLYNCSGDVAVTNGILIYVPANGFGNLNINNCNFTNSIDSPTGFSLNVAGTANFNNCTTLAPITIDVAVTVNITNSTFNSSSGIICAGTLYAANSNFILGSTGDFNIIATTGVVTLVQCDINGSAGNVITVGTSATLNYALLSFSGSSSGISNSGTLNPLATLV